MNFVLSDVADAEAEKAIRDPLVAYNIARFGESDKRELNITIRDDENAVTGGLVGYTGRGWLYVQLLFVPETMRGKGTAAKLLAMAEEEARKRGCTGAYIDTMNPDALRTYERYGFTRIGSLGPLSSGQSITWLEKRF
ncbi:Acetyltransferase [Rhizobium rhizogenes]|uniref:Acetyltransferase n=1 Tax=Rhizobium rhizogenes TaxID=359 RepID=A0AAN2A535_RHIRH|nr:MULTISPECIES: GNAT family N-acetyltransferase [Rhizobium/Agrobacterium group]AQS61136.1 GNAT family N-acetyltransferase [Rhizobium rhizogenes]MCZ7443882.1 GNAT family N-acetyltransferase [Rhizobium rhizogenes]NSX91367.1 GNAT family N-acetyltransferase [Agrobacterium tumefaciens]NSZ79702.1 GNAT family N-acetyltransferase [Agrobacterium tumefaciens]NTE54828.1 GNAT family N-acetyltransferase [Agrobacterium tumefaciens]